MFTVADIEKIAELAALELTPAEKAQFAEQFQAILDYMRKIEGVELPEGVEGDEATAAAPLREDVAVPSPVHPEDFSPYLEDHHFKVPKVIE